LGSATDFLGMAAVGIVVLVAYFWFKQHQGGGGQPSCIGTSGNCIYNMCTSGAYQFCWRGIGNATGAIGQVCAKSTGLPNPTLVEGCNYARSAFIKCVNDPKCPWQHVGGIG